jgi:hypothetical protein
MLSVLIQFLALVIICVCVNLSKPVVAHEASYPMSTGGKRPGREADHLKLMSRSRMHGSLHPRPHSIVLN